MSSDSESDTMEFLKEYEIDEIGLRKKVYAKEKHKRFVARPDTQLIELKHKNKELRHTVAVLTQTMQNLVDVLTATNNKLMTGYNSKVLANFAPHKTAALATLDMVELYTTRVSNELSYAIRKEKLLIKIPFYKARSLFVDHGVSPSKLKGKPIDLHCVDPRNYMFWSLYNASLKN